MRIKLDDTHYLISDGECYWIIAIVQGKNKTYERRVSGYCTTFGRAVVTAMRKNICSRNVTSLRKLAQHIEELEQQIMKWENPQEEGKDEKESREKAKKKPAESKPTRRRKKESERK